MPAPSLYLPVQVVGFLLSGLLVGLGLGALIEFDMTRVVLAPGYDVWFIPVGE